MCVEGRRTERTKKILSCFGKMNRISTARVLGVSPAWVSFVWLRAGLDYDDELFVKGYI